MNFKILLQLKLQQSRFKIVKKWKIYQIKKNKLKSKDRITAFYLKNQHHPEEMKNLILHFHQNLEYFRINYKVIQIVQKIKYIRKECQRNHSKMKSVIQIVAFKK
jgi:hypothetical protein